MKKITLQEKLIAKKITLEEKAKIQADSLFDDVMRRASKKLLEPQRIREYELIELANKFKAIHSRFPQLDITTLEFH